MPPAPFPPARGRRLLFADLPLSLRRRIEQRLRARVVGARSHPEGFSPGLAASLRLEGGRRCFLKAVSSKANPDSPSIHLREAEVARRLPPGVPAPRFLWSLEEPPWVVLAFEDVEGRTPRLPWRPRELERVLAAMERLSAALTPSPMPVPTTASAHRLSFRNWRGPPGKGEPGPTPDRSWGPWTRRHLHELADLEGRWERASRGRTLLHSDVRADNVLLAREGEEVHFVDWPWACRGAPWVDLTFFLPSVAMQGGPPPWEIFDDHPLAAGARAEDVDAVLAALCGFFLHRGRSPPPPGLPTLRPFQWLQGLEALRWLRYRREGVDDGAPTWGSRAP